jgi:hypothetical protein
MGNRAIASAKAGGARIKKANTCSGGWVHAAQKEARVECRRHLDHLLQGMGEKVTKAVGPAGVVLAAPDVTACEYELGASTKRLGRGQKTYAGIITGNSSAR